MSLYWTKNPQLYNFLWTIGIKPVAEEGESAGYRRTIELQNAIESFEIRNFYFKNRR